MSVLDRTHEVTNQAPPLEGHNIFEADLPLREALEREGGHWGVDRARDLGQMAGSEEARDVPSATSPASSPTTATATASTGSSSTLRGTGCCAWPSSARSPPFPGAIRSRERTWFAARSCTSGRR